jgi:hypothetical protein
MECMMTRNYLQDIAVVMVIILKLKLKTRDYYDFWTLSIVRYSKEHNVSETGFLFVFRWRWSGEWETPTLLGPLERANPNPWTQ